MKAIQANLAQLYQQSYLLMHYLIFGFLLFPLVIFWNKHPFEISMILSAAIYGVAALITTRYIESLTKPMVFCLPGHTLIIRKILFRIGFIVSMISAAIFAFRNTNNYEMLAYNLLVYTSLYMLFWIIGIWVASKVRISSIFGLFIVFAFGIGYLNNFVSMQPFLFSPYSAVIILIAWIFSLYAWRYFGRTDIARIYCNQPKVSLFYLSQERATRKIEKEHITQITTEEKTVAAFERFFLPRISSQASHHIIPFFWGTLYKSIGRFILSGNWIIFPILLLFVSAAGYIFGPGFTLVTLAMGWVFGNGCYDLNFHPALILKEGRTQLFWTEITKTALALVSSLITFVFISFWMKIMFLCIPAACQIGKYDIPESNICLSFVYLLLFIFPFVKINYLLFSSKNTTHVCPLIFMLILFLALMKSLPDILPLKNTTVVFLLALSWGTFIAVLYWTCLHRTLSIQKTKGI